ncbi:hypothetical protein BDP55DRAFT_677582, partial [Colletotrichum godetiae]
MSLRPRLVILASQLGLHFTCEGRVNSPQIAPSEFVPRVRCGPVLRVDIDEPTGFEKKNGNMHAPQMLMIPVRRYAYGVESNKNQRC